MEAISTQERHRIKLEVEHNLEIEQLIDEMEKEVQKWSDYKFERI